MECFANIGASAPLISWSVWQPVGTIRRTRSNTLPRHQQKRCKFLPDAWHRCKQHPQTIFLTAQFPTIVPEDFLVMVSQAHFWRRDHYLSPRLLSELLIHDNSCSKHIPWANPEFLRLDECGCIVAPRESWKVCGLRLSYRRETFSCLKRCAGGNIPAISSRRVSPVRLETIFRIKKIKLPWLECSAISNSMSVTSKKSDCLSEWEGLFTFDVLHMVRVSDSSWLEREDKIISVVPLSEASGPTTYSGKNEMLHRRTVTITCFTEIVPTFTLPFLLRIVRRMKLASALLINASITQSPNQV